MSGAGEGDSGSEVTTLSSSSLVAAAPSSLGAAAAPRRVVPRAAVSAVIFDEQGRVLLVERGRPPGEGLWTVPGGKVEPGELLADAVRREVAEETGLLVEVGPLVTVIERIDLAAGYHYVILDYLAHRRGGELLAGSDARSVRFCAQDDLAALPLTDGLRPVIDEARRLAATAAATPADSPSP